jgi:hypothetical protein
MWRFVRSVFRSCLKVVLWRVERRRECSIGPLRVKIHSGMPRGGNMSLALNEPETVALHSNSNTIPSMHHHKWKDSLDCMQNNQWKFRGDQLPTEMSP